MTEFELIQRFFAGDRAKGEVALGIGDDCALIRWSPSDYLAISTDSQVEGRHFPARYPAACVATRALGAATSDLAAMGAMPMGCLLALTLPKPDPEWVKGFSDAFKACADKWQIPLLGGDTTAGPLQVTVTVLGRVSAKEALLRSGASVGDDLWVSGRLGDAAGALKFRQAEPDQAFDELPQGPVASLVARYDRPEPRLSLGIWLLGKATAAIDISDGLVADVGHICDRSGLGAEIRLESLPVSDALSQVYPASEIETFALYGGDDYELCFSAPAHLRTQLEQAPFSLTRIGHMTTGGGVQLSRGGKLFPPTGSGFDHFRGQ